MVRHTLATDRARGSWYAPAVDARTQTSFIAALLCFALAASVLLRTQRQRDRWLFGILAMNTGLWYVGAFMLGVVGREPY